MSPRMVPPIRPMTVVAMGGPRDASRSAEAGAGGLLGLHGPEAMRAAGMIGTTSAQTGAGSRAADHVGGKIHGSMMTMVATSSRIMASQAPMARITPAANTPRRSRRIHVTTR